MNLKPVLSPPVEAFVQGMFQVAPACPAHVAIKFDVHIPSRAGIIFIRCPHIYPVWLCERDIKQLQQQLFFFLFI